MVLFGIVNTATYISPQPHCNDTESVTMEKKIECPRGIPEAMCDHAPHCNVWKLRETTKKQA
jgi:hypothetical protein